MIKIKKGLDLPMSGAPVQEISASPTINSCALLGQDYIGLKPTMAVKEGDSVQVGQVLFSDKKNTALRVVSPIAGQVSAIHRGHKRVLLSVVIEQDERDQAKNHVVYEHFNSAAVLTLSAERVRRLLIESGLWVALKQRPFGTVPHADDEPQAIFITAMDTHPLAADPGYVIEQRQEEFKLGLEAISKLTQRKKYLCTKPALEMPKVSGIEHVVFDGPHPAGLVGTHIHNLAPASESTQVWYINYQDVIAIGHLFRDGRYDAHRVIALAGPQVEQPRLVRTVLGAKLELLAQGQMKAGENRVISGSVLGGVHGRGVKAFLGRYHLQVSILKEGRERGLVEYLSLGKNKHSVAGLYLSQFAKALRLPMTTSTNGSQRAMVPIGLYEEVMPLDILPTQLLRAIIVGDIEAAIELGVLELEEEDLALCTYVCPGKYEYGPILRENLARIEQEG